MQDNPEKSNLLDEWQGIVAQVQGVDGKLDVVWVWWEGLPQWLLVYQVEEWPAEREVALAFIIENTGNQPAFFGIRFMELESSKVLLNPGEHATAYLYPVMPSPGVYQETIEVLADGETVASYTLEMNVVGVPEPEFSGFAISDYSKR